MVMPSIIIGHDVKTIFISIEPYLGWSEWMWLIKAIMKKAKDGERFSHACMV